MQLADLRPAQQAELLQAFGDHEKFCRESLSLRDRLGGLVPLEMWPSQRKLCGAIRRQQREKRPVRLVVLKTRRSGFTLGSCSHLFAETCFLPGRRGMIIADTYDPAAVEAYGYLRDFVATYRPFERHGVSIRPRQVRAADMALKEADREVINVYSAERGEIRGGGRHWALFDELAFWRAPEQTLRAAMTMVPDEPETGIIIQSTANGVGGEFWQLCQNAQNPALAGGFEFVFFGWLEDPNNAKPFESRDEMRRFQDSLDLEEQQLVQFHQATLEQLNWRRWKIATNFSNRVDDFHQEYPTTPEEAFLTSGRPALDHKALARQPVMDGSVGELQQTDDYRPRLIFTPRQHGSLTIWTPPQRGRWYIAGADPSKGRDVSEDKRGRDPDWSVATVHDGETGEQVALLRDRLRPVPFGEYFALLCRWYHWAFAVPESNDPGFIDAILNSGYPLERIYRQQRDPSDRRSTSLDEIGFYQTEITRQWLIGALDSALIDGSLQLHSAVAVQECRTFVIKPNGKAEHQVGCHDDCVFAGGLVAIGRRTVPRHLMTRSPAQMAADAKPQKWGRRRSGEDDDDELPPRRRA